MNGLMDALAAIAAFVVLAAIIYISTKLVGRLRKYIDSGAGWTNGAHAGIMLLDWLARIAFLFLITMVISWIYNGRIAIPN